MLQRIERANQPGFGFAFRALGGRIKSQAIVTQQAPSRSFEMEVPSLVRALPCMRQLIDYLVDLCGETASGSGQGCIGPPCPQDKESEFQRHMTD